MQKDVLDHALKIFDEDAHTLSELRFNEYFEYACLVAPLNSELSNQVREMSIDVLRRMHDPDGRVFTEIVKLVSLNLEAFTANQVTEIELACKKVLPQITNARSAHFVGDILVRLEADVDWSNTKFW